MSAAKPAVKLTDEEEAREDLRHFAELIEHFDTHDIGDELVGMPEVHFEIILPPRRKRYPLDAVLAAQLDSIASQRGISPETLLNEWVREKTAETEAVGVAK